MNENAASSETNMGSPLHGWQGPDRRRRLEALLQLSERPHVAVRDLAEALRANGELADAVRQRANASARGLPKQIASLEHAVVYLGLSEIRRLVREQLTKGSAPTILAPESATDTPGSVSSWYRESA